LPDRAAVKPLQMRYNLPADRDDVAGLRALGRASNLEIVWLL